METMERKGSVVRFVDRLDISDTAKRLAQNLVNQIEMPVVFLIDHDLDKQYALRSRENHNQFWVLACHQEEQSEYERIILSNIYRGVQARKRFLHLAPHPEYEARINQITSPEMREKRQKLYYELLNKISSFVSTIDAELYFKPKGIEVSQIQKQWLYDDRISILDEYLGLQKTKECFRWCREHECINVIDYARIASFNEEYKAGIIGRLKRIKPSAASRRCIKRVSKLSRIIIDAREKHGSLTQEEIAKWMLQETVRILAFENEVDFKREYALNGSFVMENGERADVYSYVPVGFDDELTVIRAMRCINEGIVLLQEYNAALLNKKIPDVHANLINSQYINAYSNMLSSKYYLSFTVGLLRAVMRSAPDCMDELPDGLVKKIGEDEARSRLTRYALFYIAAHEYAHVINGDCEAASSYQAALNLVDKKEELADSFAKEMLHKLLFMQYRLGARTDLLSEIQRFTVNQTVDPILLCTACNWCDRFFSRLKKERPSQL